MENSIAASAPQSSVQRGAWRSIVKTFMEQEGERLNKELNEIEAKLVHIKNKPFRYFQVIRDLENKIFSNRKYFETRKRNKKTN